MPEERARTLTQRWYMQRLSPCEAALAQARDSLEEDRFVAALGAFREALNLSHGVPDLERMVFTAGLEEAGQLASWNWRVAESLLSELAQLNSRLVVPAELWDQLRRQQRKEAIKQVLAQVTRAEDAGDLANARARLVSALNRFPETESLLARLRAIEPALAEKRRREEQAARERAALADYSQNLEQQLAAAPQVDRRESILKAALREYPGNIRFARRLEQIRAGKTLAKAAAARARQFEKSDLPLEALEQWELLRALDPLYPGLDAAISRCKMPPRAPAIHTLVPLASAPVIGAPLPNTRHPGRWVKIGLGVAAAMAVSAISYWWPQKPSAVTAYKAPLPITTMPAQLAQSAASAVRIPMAEAKPKRTGARSISRTPVP